MNKFLLVDDHTIIRSGIKTLLSEIFAEFEVHEAMDGNEALIRLKDFSYDVVIMDIQLPNTNINALLQTIHEEYPAIKVLIFSMGAESIYAKALIKAGAHGFVSKEAPLEEIEKAIKLVFNGGVYISERVSDSLVNDFILGKTSERSNPFNKLSAREFEIALLLLSGKSATEISGSLNIMASTVATHKARIFQKMGVTNLMALNELVKFYS